MSEDRQHVASTATDGNVYSALIIRAVNKNILDPRQRDRHDRGGGGGRVRWREGNGHALRKSADTKPPLPPPPPPSPSALPSFSVTPRWKIPTVVRRIPDYRCSVPKHGRAWRRRACYFPDMRLNSSPIGAKCFRCINNA